MGPRRITSTGFRLGPVNRPLSLPPNRPAPSLNDRGRGPRRCWVCLSGNHPPGLTRERHHPHRASRWAMTAMGHLHPYVTSSATDCRAPKPAVPPSWVERVKPSTSTLIQTRMRVSPDCFPSSRPGRDRERGTAMIYAGRFILYRDRWCAAEGRRSDGHPVPQALHFSNTEHGRFASNWSVRLLRPLPCPLTPGLSPALFMPEDKHRRRD